MIRRGEGKNLVLPGKGEKKKGAINQKTENGEGGPPASAKKRETNEPERNNQKEKKARGLKSDEVRGPRGKNRTPDRKGKPKGPGKGGISAVNWGSSKMPATARLGKPPWGGECTRSGLGQKLAERTCGTKNNSTTTTEKGAIVSDKTQVKVGKKPVTRPRLYKGKSSLIGDTQPARQGK